MATLFQCGTVEIGAEESRTLLERAHAGDRAARLELFWRPSPLVANVLWRFRFRLHSGNRGDMENEASVALLSAIDRFAPDSRIALVAFAYRCIWMRVLDALLAESRGGLRLARESERSWSCVLRVRRRLAQELGRAPTVPEIAAHHELPAALRRSNHSCAQRHVREVLAASLNRFELDAASDQARPGDTTPEEEVEEQVMHAARRLALQRAFKVLTEQERRVMETIYRAGCRMGRGRRAGGARRVTGMSTDAFYSRYRSARRKLSRIEWLREYL